MTVPGLRRSTFGLDLAPAHVIYVHEVYLPQVVDFFVARNISDASEDVHVGAEQVSSVGEPRKRVIALKFNRLDPAHLLEVQHLNLAAQLLQLDVLCAIAASEEDKEGLVEDAGVALPFVGRRLRDFLRS